MIHILTGEYPPTAGGVSDYVALIAGELTIQGERVHVWAPGHETANEENGPLVEAQGVTVHRVAGKFGLADLARLDRELNLQPGPRRLLVQWTPHSYGWRSCNLALTTWLWKRAHVNRDRVEIMVHEAFLAFGEGNWRQDVAAAVHRLMAVLLMDAAAKVWVSIPAWKRQLRPWCLRGKRPFQWLPVPSNIVRRFDSRSVLQVRAEIAPHGECLIGHFGTFRPEIVRLLAPALEVVLDRTKCMVLLAGKGSDKFSRFLKSRAPMAASRIVATGELAPREIARRVKACDLLLQPYPDGISTRRGTAMAALALGIPMVTNLGHLSEAFWRKSGAVVLAHSALPGDLAGAAIALGADEKRRGVVAHRSRKLYKARFDVCYSVAALLDRPPVGPLSLKASA